MERSYPSGTVLLEKYRVDSVVGRGGMAMVLRATHLQLGEQVALKITRQRYRRRFATRSISMT